MILDATAANHCIWETKFNDEIVYIDFEKRLQIKPTLFADNRYMPFSNEIFDTIFYDPPYAWNFQSIYWGYPNADEAKKFWKPELAKPETMRKLSHVQTYYGMERYKNKTDLISAIWKAQKEFQRVLKNDGVLWLKWNELRLTMNRILVLFNEWSVMLRLRIDDPNQQLSDFQTFWIMLMKKTQTSHESLETFIVSEVQQTAVNIIE